MNGLIHDALIALFLVTAPGLLLFRALGPRQMPWWLTVTLAVAISWALLNLAVYFYQRHLYELLIAAGGPDSAPEALIDEWQSDGARNIFTFLFGWLYGLIYFSFWAAVYVLVAWFRNRV